MGGLLVMRSYGNGEGGLVYWSLIPSTYGIPKHWRVYVMISLVFDIVNCCSLLGAFHDDGKFDCHEETYNGTLSYASFISLVYLFRWSNNHIRIWPCKTWNSLGCMTTASRALPCENNNKKKQIAESLFTRLVPIYVL